MKKTIKKVAKKTIGVLIILSIMVATFNLEIIKAGNENNVANYQFEFSGVGGDVVNNTVSYYDGETLKGTANLSVSNTAATITKNVSLGDGNEIHYESQEITNGSNVVISTTTANNYQLCGVIINGQSYNADATGKVIINGYQATNSHINIDVNFGLTCQQSNTPNPNNPPIEAIKFDFTLNGQSFTNVSIGDQLAVPDNFNMDNITELYITRISIEGVRTYIYAENEYSYNLRDSQNLRILETHFDKKSDNYAKIRIEAHSKDLLDKDIAQGKTKDDYFGIYITGLSFVKSGFRGVEVSTGVMPDNYDFTVWNGSDLKGTTEGNPGKVTAYYGEDTIRLSSAVASNVSEISLVSGSGIPSSAVSINNTTGEITVLSNYYNEIPLQIKLQDGTVGYVTVNRIGIFIGDLNVGNDEFFHGSFANVGKNLNVDTDKNRVVAVFYHEDTTTYEDYDLIVNITYDDGKTETSIAQGVGDVHNSSGDIIGSDYILWKGNNNTPKKISVTAVKKGAVSNKNTFGGATFGSGAGVEWERRGNA